MTVTSVFGLSETQPFVKFQHIYKKGKNIFLANIYKATSLVNNTHRALCLSGRNADKDQRIPHRESNDLARI